MSNTNTLQKRLISLGQDHVWGHCESLGEDKRDAFLSELAHLDFNALEEAIGVALNDKVSVGDSTQMSPPSYIASPCSGGDKQAWVSAKTRGESLLASGKVAVLTVAGGQGTRLGLSGPKGCFGVTPIKAKSLFQVFAEKILAAQLRYETTFLWLIMTSHVNNDQTVEFFRENRFFGLSETQIIFFKQGLFPAVDFKGKLIIEAPGHLAMSPDGHGGTFDALAGSGALARLRAEGVETLSYFQVDNPLVNVLDPSFIGFHHERGASMSSKMVVKENPEEKVGLFCERKGVLGVVEYSDIPKSFAEAHNPDGNLTFRAGNIAVHLIDRDFAERIAAQHALPFHCARKAIPFLNAQGILERPETPNGIKFEKFIFDALQFAVTPLILETMREDEFSPVKNAKGVDSPETSKLAQSAFFARWLEAAGEVVPRDEAGNPCYNLEVNPLFADNVEIFINKWKSLDPKPSLGGDLYLA